MSDQTGYFELRFAPTVALVSTVRRFVSEFYSQQLADPELAHNLGMATHEMLENASAYSRDGRSQVTIALRHVGAEVDISIQTKNNATPERLALVREALDALCSAPDPNVHYMVLMRRAAKRRDGGSGLGLGRIRAEADLALKYAIEGDTLTLTAHGAFSQRAPREAVRQEAG